MPERLLNGVHDAPCELISFTVGAQEFCVDAMCVQEMRGWTPATLMPHSPTYMHGVINLRGTVLPIVDLSARLDLGPTDPTARHVVIVVRIGRKLVGLLVDAVCDILMVAEDAFQPTPNLPSKVLASLISGLVTVDGRAAGLLALDKLLPGLEEAAA